ncbi:MAG: glycosyltransferase family 4 protein [Solirubrobacterales bacterium]
MNFGIDARAAAEVPAGRGRYVRELLRHLATLPGDDTWELFARTPWEEPSLDGRFRWRLIDLPDPAWHLAAGLRAGACEAFLSTNSYLTAWVCRCPCAVVVHDLVTFYPEHKPQRRAAWIERVTIDWGVRRAASLIAVSEATRNDLVGRHPEAGSKAVVIPHAAGGRFRADPGPDDAELLRALGVEEPFVLSTGTLEPRKNLVRLIEAFAGLTAGDRTGHELVLAGPTGWEVQQIVKRVTSHRDVVRTVGHVSEDELEALYRRAAVFAYPSLYEGFGLPVLEAMQSGTPVLTSNRSSLPEVAGDAAVYVDPLSSEEIRSALQGLLVDKGRRKELSRLGVDRARLFDWRSTARATRDLLVQIAEPS